MKSKRCLFNDKVRIAGDIKHVSPRPSSTENQVWSVVWDKKSKTPAKINTKISGVAEVIPGHQTIL